MRCRSLAAGLGVLLGLTLSSATAFAATPSQNIGASPAGPLTQIALGNDASCQIKHTGDTSGEFYPPSATPGDCGTFLVVGGALFAPDFANHDGSATGSIGSYTPFTPVSQSGKTGSGTTASPFKVVTTVNAGATGVSITQTDSYVSGQESYRTDTTVTNNSGGPQSIVLYRAGDCYLQNSDSGFGFTGPNNSVGCSANANNSPAGRIEEWVPITAGSTFLEDDYSSVWQAIGTHAPFSNQCNQCTVKTDNGAGISWTATLQNGQSVTFSHFTTFSPTGRSGPPPATTGDLQQAKLPRCLSVPSVIRNRTQLVRGLGSVTLKTRQVDNPAFPLRLSLALRGRLAIASVTWRVNGKIVAGAGSLSVPVSLLKIGSRFVNTVKATVVLTNGKVVQLTQHMVILKCRVPTATCKVLANKTSMRCKSRTPLSGRRALVTVTRSAAETAKGTATVSKGRYTVVVRSKNPLGTGVYAYKAVVLTNRRSVRFQMIRLVTVT